MEQKFIDLGLPSGNLWATENEVAENGQPLYATYDEAVENFGKNLPTKDDWQELIDNVPHLWDKKRDGLLFVARNGKELFLPAMGYRDEASIYKVHLVGYYWSVTPEVLQNGGKYAYKMYFDQYEVYAESIEHLCYGPSVRLIKKGGKQ